MFAKGQGPELTAMEKNGKNQTLQKIPVILNKNETEFSYELMKFSGARFSRKSR